MIIGHITVTYAAGKALGKRFPALSCTPLFIFGAVLPDLVDKPLSAVFGFPGRGPAHSAVLQLALPAILTLLFRKRRAGIAAVSAGAMLHLLADFIPLSTALWPLLGPFPAEIRISFMEKIMNYYVRMAAPFSLAVEAVSYPFAGYFLFRRMNTALPGNIPIPEMENP